MAAVLDNRPTDMPANADGLPMPANDRLSMSGYDVFISYARNDREFVAGLARALEAQGLKAWYDATVEGHPGANLDRLEDSGLLLVVFSNSSNAETELTRQVALADKLGKPVAPILLDDAVPNGGRLMALSDRNWTAVRSEDLSGIEAVADQITGIVGARANAGAASAYVGKRAGAAQSGAKPKSLLGWIDVALIAVLVAMVGGWLWLSLDGRGGPITTWSAIAVLGLAVVGLYLAIALSIRMAIRPVAPLHPARTLLLGAGLPVLASALAYVGFHMQGAFASDDPFQAAGLFLGLIAVYAALGGFILVLLSGRGAMRRFRANIRKI